MTGMPAIDRMPVTDQSQLSTCKHSVGQRCQHYDISTTFRQLCNKLAEALHVINKWLAQPWAFIDCGHFIDRVIFAVIMKRHLGALRGLTLTPRTSSTAQHGFE